MRTDKLGTPRNWARAAMLLCLVMLPICWDSGSAVASPPTPLLEKGKAVDWWFVFKFNSGTFPACGANAVRACIFGGTPRNYHFYGQQFVYASSQNPSLQSGNGCAGDTVTDPVGATFEQVYDGTSFYVIWNDQFYDDPQIAGCSGSCSSPWGHSKGVVAWDSNGSGFLMQVTTPSWPASGSKDFPRKTDGNTLGCVKDDNVEVSQHFFALRLTKADLVKVLGAIKNASVVTDPSNPQIVRNGGPSDIQALVSALGTRSDNTRVLDDKLSVGVEMLSKPSALHVPSWQMVSSELGGINLRAATWWASPKIYTTKASTPVACWEPSLTKPGAVEIAVTGHWDQQEIGLTGGSGPNFNHAKIGVSTSGSHHYAIFGDMNQQGAIAGNCGSSQNGRGGLFFVLDNVPLSRDVAKLIAGTTAPTGPPN
jgi:hypothetical protein